MRTAQDADVFDRRRAAAAEGLFVMQLAYAIVDDAELERAGNT